MKRIAFVLTTILLAASISYGQAISEFKDLEDGFRVAQGTERNGDHIVLILYPEKYLESLDTYIEGSKKVLVLLYGCENFKDCVPNPLPDKGTDYDGIKYVAFDLLKEPNHTLALFSFGNAGERPFGIILKLIPKKPPVSN